MTVSIDRYGRVWDLPATELCPNCRQPDNCGDCNCDPLTESQIRLLAGRTETPPPLRLVRFRQMRPHQYMRSIYLVPPTDHTDEQIRADVATSLANYRQQENEIKALSPPKWYSKEEKLEEFPDHITIAEAKRLREEADVALKVIKQRNNTRKSFTEWMGQLGYRDLRELLENEIDAVDVVWDNDLYVLDEYDY